MSQDRRGENRSANLIELLGLGTYQITSDSGAAGASDSGQITINYELYNGNPLDGGADLGSFSYSVPFTVNVEAANLAAVPEPGSLVLVTSGMALAFAARRRKHGNA